MNLIHHWLLQAGPVYVLWHLCSVSSGVRMKIWHILNITRNLLLFDWFQVQSLRETLHLLILFDVTIVYIEQWLMNVISIVGMSFDLRKTSPDRNIFIVTLAIYSTQTNFNFRWVVWHLKYVQYMHCTLYVCYYSMSEIHVLVE